MIKRLVYIVLLLIFVSGLSSAKTKTSHYIFATGHAMRSALLIQTSKDTLNTKKHQQEEDKKKIKEILKAKRQSKPEKIDGSDNVQDPKVKPKLKRERRPEGLERPPEIPRRNGN
jgi:Skp family chaperone for outer membrane proteins